MGGGWGVRGWGCIYTRGRLEHLKFAHSTTVLTLSNTTFFTTRNISKAAKPDTKGEINHEPTGKIRPGGDKAR